MGPDPDEQRGDPEESGEQREQGGVRVDQRRAAEGRNAQQGREGLDPGRADDPTKAGPSAKFGCEDRAQDEHEERGGPRPESIRQVDRIREKKPQWHQGDDRERRPEEGAAGREGDSFRALADEQQTMARQRGEGGVLGRRTQEDGRDAPSRSWRRWTVFRSRSWTSRQTPREA